MKNLESLENRAQEALTLESLEGRTPEFQALTPEEQNHRRKMLSSVLEGVLEEGIESGLSEREAGRFVGFALEFYLTGRVDENHQELIVKRSKKHPRQTPPNQANRNENDII